MRLAALPLVVACLLLAGCQQPAPSADTAGKTASPSSTDAFPYAELDIADLQARMTRGELDSTTLTRAYLARIAALDREGPRLNSVLALNPDAPKEAAERDAERRAGHVRGPLHGIPILLKDNIDATPMATTAGSLALAGLHPARDAFLVQRLRAAGAVILGKTNLSEWANFRSAHSTSGWSAQGGQTRNPYALDRNPCGSSAGTGVAISANLAAAGIGTETDGSIVCPAAINGLVGLKPTVGLVSRDGIVPISFSQDTAGPMTRSVADAAVLLGAIAGRDPADPATATRPGLAVYDYTARLKPEALKGARLGVLRSRLTENPALAAALDAALAALRQAGATVVEAQIPTDGQWEADEQTVLLYEFKAGLARYLAAHDAPLRDLDALIAFNRENAAREMPHFGQDLFEAAAAKGELNAPEYIGARTRARRLAGPLGIDAALKAQQLDALIAPTTGVAWLTDPVHGDDFPGGNYGAAAVAGYPSLNVPMGNINGLPVGLLFMGTAWSEPRLLELGYAYEQLTAARQPPRFLPTAATEGTRKR
ncbi:amidase [Stenotrophomonas sp. HITSZ_GD]|uniref:amidase n=1 Tax=Stenotrophomonas sp. HITSZ_GD TaxID=3037248 RepID=UPI00240CFA12|nr:amidase [Stenotrophomonas sp. HITSZ_GD]MDG2524776.1 amidase [Stenotrophomonas sp. HITSZ_GD]